MLSDRWEIWTRFLLFPRSPAYPDYTVLFLFGPKNVLILGLGGVGGPYRLDAGHNVHQVPEAAKTF